MGSAAIGVISPISFNLGFSCKVIKLDVVPSMKNELHISHPSKICFSQNRTFFFLDTKSFHVPKYYLESLIKVLLIIQVRVYLQ